MGSDCSPVFAYPLLRPEIVIIAGAVAMWFLFSKINQVMDIRVCLARDKEPVWRVQQPDFKWPVLVHIREG